LNIAVAGCGIAGAAVASLLRDQGHAVTIFEQTQVCRPVGAGIMLQASGQRVLTRMGLLASLSAASQRLNGMTAKLPSGRDLVRIEFGKYDDAVYSLGVHRGRLFESLMNQCIERGVEIRTGVRVVGIEPGTGTVSLESEQGGSSVSGFDFLIAADGSRSALRERSNIVSRVREYDYGALWTTGRCDFQPGELYQVVDGTHRLLGLLPIGGGESSFFWGLPKASWPALQRSSLAEWKDEACRLCPQAETMVNAFDSFEALTFGTYRNVTMRKWHGDNVVFLGDAAHATSPHLGQGVNLALEDAETFADALQETNEFEQACRAYTKRRSSKLRYYRQLTGLLTPFFQSRGRIRGIGRDVVLPVLPRLPLVGRRMVKTLSGDQGGWF